MKIFLGSDHAGFKLKAKIIDYLQSEKIDFEDCGTHSEESCDYPDYAHKVAKSIKPDLSKNKGIVICNSGNGINMTVNKYAYIRSALCWNKEIAMFAKRHNDANILSLPAGYISEQEALECVKAFFSETFEGGRHERRVKKIAC